MATIENIREIMSLNPYSIKKTLIDIADKNFGARSPDLYEAGFLGYFIQAQTLLASDVLFNNSIAWNEAFTHLLTLPTSLQNTATMFDYQLSSATPCTGSITVYVPYPDQGSQYQLSLRNGTVCEGTVKYLVKNTYIINVSYVNPTVQKRDSITGLVSDVDINIEIKDGNRYLVFNVDVWQVSILALEDKFKNVEYKEFYDVNISGITDYFHDISIGVYIQDNNFADPRLIRFKQVPSIYSCTSKDRAYTLKLYGDGKATVRFGNGVFGYQPAEGSTYQILVYMTKGKEGLAYPGQVTLDIDLVDFYSGSSVSIYGANSATIDNGESEEDIEVAKANIIAQTSSARRLVTKNDFNGFSGITGIKNVELFPMLLRRDTNANEVDLFSVIYDNNGMPVPTTNVNFIVGQNRKIISKDFVYKLAMKYGTHGVELVPNVLKIIDSTAIDSEKHDVYSAIYIDSEYDNYDPVYSYWDKKIIYNYSDNTKTYVDPDKIVEYVCPFNLDIEDKAKGKVGTFEYIPYSFDDQPTIEDQIDITDIEMSIKSMLFTYKPDTALITTVQPTHINSVITINMETGMDPSLIQAYIRMYKLGPDGSISEISPNPDMEGFEKGYPCGSKIVNSENTEVSTAYQIPINDLLVDDFIFEVTLYYGNKYYNSYKKYMKFVDSLNNNLVQTYIDTPVTFTYSESDPDEVKRTDPAIDRVYISVTNVNAKWTQWIDDNGFTIDGYIVEVELNKLKTVDDTSRVKCLLCIGYGEEEIESVSMSDFDDTRVTYTFRVPYNPNYIMNGETYYQVKILYAFKYEMYSGGQTSDDSPYTFSPFATYSGYITFRRKLSQVMWCNIEKLDSLTETKYKIYKIPVINKDYYDANKDYLESKVSSQLAMLDEKAINYKMLTMKLNFKFAKTIGSTENLKFNDVVENLDESLLYNGWTSDMPPTIRLRVLISSSSSRSKSDITNECRQVLLSFLQLKANFNAKIVRSEMARYIHDTVSDVMSCEVLEPTRDIMYMYSEDDLPTNKDVVLSYNPEFLWIDVDKIYVDVVSANL